MNIEHPVHEPTNPKHEPGKPPGHHDQGHPDPAHPDPHHATTTGGTGGTGSTGGSSGTGGSSTGGTHTTPPGPTHSTTGGGTTAPPPPHSPPSTPLTTAASKLTERAGKDGALIGGNTGGSQKVTDRFHDAPNELSASWKDYESKLIAQEKARIQGDGLSWSKDGGADLEKALPDIDKTLNEWQTLKEKNPFDSTGLSAIADRLAGEFDSYTYLLEHGKGFSSVATMSLTKGLEAVCGEVGRQAEALNDPVKSATSDLDKLSGEVLQPKSRQKFEDGLKTTQPDKYWSKAKGTLTGFIDNKVVAKEVNAVFSGELGKSLATWSSLVTSPQIDVPQLMAVTRELTDKLTAYESALAAIDLSKATMKTDGAVTGLRDCLRAIAGRVSHDTNWVASMGASPNV